MKPFLLMIGVLCSLPAQADPEATHHGHWQNNQMRWQTQWYDDVPRTDVRFTEPLPRGASVLDGGQSVTENGRITAIQLPTVQTEGAFTVIVTQDTGDTQLHVPLIASERVQEITVSGVDFEPSPEAGLDKHIGYWAVQEFRSRDRRHFGRRMRAHGLSSARRTAGPIYVRRGQSPPQGLSGRLVLEDARRARHKWLLGALGLCAILLAVALYRGLGALARKERNEAYIRDHIG